MLQGTAAATLISNAKDIDTLEKVLTRQTAIEESTA